MRPERRSRIQGLSKKHGVDWRMVLHYPPDAERRRARPSQRVAAAYGCKHGSDHSTTRRRPVDGLTATKRKGSTGFWQTSAETRASNTWSNSRYSPRILEASMELQLRFNMLSYKPLCGRASESRSHYGKNAGSIWLAELRSKSRSSDIINGKVIS